jgi:glyoxylase-like metal-dependent hydrolase (beta-lactamase superfamily II)
VLKPHDLQTLKFRCAPDQNGTLLEFAGEDIEKHYDGWEGYPMKPRIPGILFCILALAAVAWVAGGATKPARGWTEVAPGVLRSPGPPFGYALVADDHALLIDAPCGPEGLGGKTIDAVLLTHHHRDTAAHAGRHLAGGVPVRASRASAEWLTTDGVRTYWQESLPLRNSRTAYLVLPEGLDGIDCTLVDGQQIDWRGWQVRVVDTPGHSRDHVAFAARKGREGPLTVFCGDALASAGKLWSPYTTDWDHWTDAGLKPTAESLHKLAELHPALLLPAHGKPISRDAAGALERTADAVAEVGFLKSFERYTKERLKNPPQYAFLAKEQSATNGSKPWSRISEHLFLTGNTYILVSRQDKAYLVVDPWDPHSAKQIPLLKKDQGLGKLEVVLCSHAHFDHYDGVYSLPARDTFEIWTLDRVAPPVADPYLLRAPFLDPRPVRIDRQPKDGEELTWREYRLRFHFLPGQTEYTMGVETEIDGKKCFFTADNFFHHDQFSGTGGWMGLNRSSPLPYAESAQKVLDARPNWVLCEHGSAMEFNAEDFRRRVEWGKVSAKAADTICVSGNHRHDWDPHRIHVEPLVHKARPGATLKATLVATNVLGEPQKWHVALEGRGLTPDQAWDLEVKAEATARREITLTLGESIGAGRHVFVLREAGGADAFVAIDVQR